MDELSTTGAAAAKAGHGAAGTGVLGSVEIRRTGGRRWRRDSPPRNRANGTGSLARRRADHNQVATDEALDANVTEAAHKRFEATRERTSASSKIQSQLSRATPSSAAGNRKNNSQPLPVLIHTDTMNASSPILHVRHPAEQSNQHQQLVAEGAAPLPAWLERQGLAPPKQALKIVIHKLQVNSTSVTLSWILAESQANEGPQATGGETSHHRHQQLPSSPPPPPPHQQPHQQREHVPGDCEGNLGGAARQRRQADRLGDFQRRRRARYPAEESGLNNKAPDSQGDGTDDEEDDHTKGFLDNRTAAGGSDTTANSKQQRPPSKLQDNSSNDAAAAGDKSGGSSLPDDEHSSSRNLQSRAQVYKSNVTEPHPASRNSHQSDPLSASDLATPESAGTRRAGGGRRRSTTSNRHSAREEPPVIKTPPASVPLNRLPQPVATPPPGDNVVSSGNGASSNDKQKRAGKSIPKLTPNQSLPLNTAGSRSILNEQTSSSPRQQQHQESTGATSTQAAASGAITSSPREQADTEAEWLVRLRRFGSEELDIVQIVARNLSRTFAGTTKPEHPEEAHLRLIVFRELLPETGYEICVESPSESIANREPSNHQQQTIDDKYQILDANQFSSTLKCQHSRLASSNSSSSPADSDFTSSSHQKSLCKEFFTLPANSNLTLVYGGGSGETSDQKQKPPQSTATGGASTQVNETTQSILRKPKSLNNVIRNRMELLEISDNQLGGNRDLNLFEVHVSQPRLENARFLSTEQVTPLSTEQTPTLRLAKSTPNQDLLSLSVLPIVGCVFGLIFIVTLANVILSAINCRSSPQASNNKKPRRGKRRHPDLGSFYSGSNISGTSQSRMVVVGAKNSEPFAISSGYFEVPSAQPSSPTSPASNYVLSRFPLGSSFEGDESHNADMVGLARKNYDNFIYNMYNSSQSVADLSTMRKHTGASRSPASFEHISISGQKHRQQYRREVAPPQVSTNEGVEYSAKENPPEEHSDSHGGSRSSEHSLKSKQRIRYDKINPIYNMEQYSSPTTGQGARAKWPVGVSSFGHSNQAMVEDEQYSSHVGSVDSPNDTSAEVEDCELCQRESSITSYVDQPFTCCLDKQKQRFEKQQQQLERVLTKNGSLIPQPFIHPIEPQSSDCQISYSNQPASLESVTVNHNSAHIVESQLNKSDQELQLISNGSTSSIKYPANQPASHSPQQQVSQELLMPPPPPLLVESPMPNPSADFQAMKKSDFDQRRNELASKLYLNGMTKLKA